MRLKQSNEPTIVSRHRFLLLCRKRGVRIGRSCAYRPTSSYGSNYVTRVCERNDGETRIYSSYYSGQNIKSISSAEEGY